MIQGTIIRVAGPVVDVQFTAGKLPALQEALTVTAEGTERTMEVTQHVNETTVRCIMLSASEGLGKGMTVTATGHGLTAPVGEATLGRMFDRWADPSTARALWTMCRTGPSTARPQLCGAEARDRDPGDRHQGHRPAGPPMQRAARSVCSAVQASARPC